MNAKKRPLREIVSNGLGSAFQAKRFKPLAVNIAPTLEKKLMPAKSQFESKLSKMKNDQLKELGKS